MIKNKAEGDLNYTRNSMEGFMYSLLFEEGDKISPYIFFHFLFVKLGRASLSLLCHSPAEDSEDKVEHEEGSDDDEGHEVDPVPGVPNGVVHLKRRKTFIYDMEVRSLHSVSPSRVWESTPPW